MAKMVFPKQIERQFKEPLEVDRLVDSLADLEVLKDKATVYPTMLVGCKENGYIYKFNELNGEFESINVVPDAVKNNEAVNLGQLHNQLWEEKERIIVDSEAYYSLETDSTLEGVKQVVTTITDIDKQILLTDVNTQTTPVDLTTLVGDGTEYVLYHDKVTHTEKYEEEIYAKKSEIPEGAMLMSTTELDDIWGTTTVLPYQES